MDDPTLPVGELPTLPQEVGEPTAPLNAASAPSSSAFHNTERSAFDNVEPEEDEPAHEQPQPHGPPSTIAAAETKSDPPVDPTDALHNEAKGDAKSSPLKATAADDDGNDDGAEDDDVGFLAGGAGASHGEEPQEPETRDAAAPDTEHRAMPSMKDLFGPFFLVDDVPAKVADPALVDTRSMLLAHFGEFVQETDVLLENEAEILTQVMEAMRANKEAREQARVEQLFGPKGLSVLRKEAQEKFTILHSSLPAAPTELLAKDPGEADGGPREPLVDTADAEKHVWLVEMPKMLPNRQTLHADPQPFFPTRCELLESDDRALYTPQNVLRWAHHKPTDTYMSNARVVRWSDGSHTLHVGSDTYSLDTAKGSAAVHILGNQTSITKGEVTLPSITKTLNPGRHFVIESTEARSIERAVMAESVQHQTKAHRMKLAYAQAPLPEVDWSKPSAARNPQEEYVAMEYERRTKELQKRFKEGRPMSLREQLEADAQLLQQLNSADVEELIERQREERRQAALHAVRRAQLAADGQRNGGRGSRLDRDMGLAALPGMDGAPDPFLTEDGSSSHGDDDERDDASSEEDFEAMMERKRQRREAEDDARNAEYAPLIAALEHALRTIPATREDEYGEVEGMITYMKSPDFSPSVLQSEIPSIAKSIAERVPEADMSKVWEAFHALPLG